VDPAKAAKGPPHLIALVPAVIGAVVSWKLSRKGNDLAAKYRSPALATSAEHQRADAIGSTAAVFAVAGALAGFHELDRVVALLEALHLIALSGILLGKSVNGLMDLAIPEDDAALVEDACRRVDGVRAVAHTRSRRSGSETWIDIVLVVPKRLSVERAHGIRRAEAAVRDALGPMAVAQIRFQGSMSVNGPTVPGGARHG
jgi:divalent metal cation (Fe/Co/Zn/Cd) transporter